MGANVQIRYPMVYASNVYKRIPTIVKKYSEPPRRRKRPVRKNWMRDRSDGFCILRKTLVKRIMEMNSRISVEEINNAEMGVTMAVTLNEVPVAGGNSAG